MTDPFAILLLTRPDAASRLFFEQIREMVPAGIAPVFSPLIEIVPTGATVDLAGVKGVIFTSASGVSHAGPAAGMPAYCVGDATAAAAADAGWPAEVRGRTADQLVADLVARPPPGPLLHIGGVHRRGRIAERLTQANIQTHSVDVYDQEQRALTEDARYALGSGRPVVLPLFSPRTAAILAAQAPLLNNVDIVALSPAVLQPVAHLLRDAATIARQPTAESLAESLLQVLRRVEADHAPQ